jgi:glutamyl-Q tRNA(Asp) synthetase
MAQLLFRFAPSPTGFLHLGHAYAALTNQNICRAHNGTMLLRMEDIDITRCRGEYETAIIEDLQWLGFEWQGEIRRQSEHFDTYHNVLNSLLDQKLAYPAELSRSEIKMRVERKKNNGEEWPVDPEGMPIYPGIERHFETELREVLRSKSSYFCVRIDIR